MNLPNKITLLRIVLIPVFIALLFVRVKYIDYIATVVFVFLALTDALDGYIARKRKQVTTLGKLMDPLADKLLVAAALIFLIGRGVPAWMAFLIIAREFAVTGLRLAVAPKGVIMQAHMWGKIKTVLQIIAIVAVILNFPSNWYIMLVAVIVTWISGIDYFLDARKHLKEEM